MTTAPPPSLRILSLSEKGLSDIEKGSEVGVASEVAGPEEEDVAVGAEEGVAFWEEVGVACTA